MESSPKQEKKSHSYPDYYDKSSAVISSRFAARRLPEVESNWLRHKCNNTEEKIGLLSSQGGKKSSRHLRRRVRSYRPRRRHRFPSIPRNPTDSSSRFKRRKKIDLGWCNDVEEDTTRLKTHVWHAKRFHMMKLFGWSIPMIHTNRGTRAALRANCTLQDCSYLCQPFELRYNRNDEDVSLFVNDVNTKLKQVRAITLNVDDCCDEILYYPGCYPQKAIGPARFLVLLNPLRVWIMVHPALKNIMNELLTELFSCNDECITTGPYSVEGGVGLLKLYGADATTLLNQTLSPTISNNRAKLYFKDCDKMIDDCLLIRQELGWDIYILPTSLHLLTKVFYALNHASACVIGLVEEARIITNKTPKQNIFPRDYPDTPIGRDYYETTSDASTLKCILDVEQFNWGKKCGRAMKQVRSNIPVSQKTTTIIHWNTLFLNETETATQTNEVVVVRGNTFGSPFVQILQSFQASTTCTNKRRPRRPVGNPSKPRNRILPTQLVSKLQSSLEQMISAISIHLLLKCSIQMEATGIIHAGASILQHDKVLLGYCVSGGFSLSKGTSCGIGFIAAKQYLHYMHAISQQKNDGSSLVVWIPSEQQIKLRVWILNNTTGSLCRLATLSIFL